MISVFILIMEIVLLSIMQKIGITDRPSFVMILMILSFSIAYIFDIQNNDDLNAAQIPLILGYGVRLCFVLFDIYGRKIMLLPNSGADTEMFYSGALTVMAGGQSNRGLFVYVVAFLFNQLGVSRLYIQFLLMLGSMVALHLGHKIMCICDIDDITRYRSMMLLCLLPNFAILSSILLRESIVTMFITISLYCFILWLKNKGNLYYVLSIVFVFVSMRFHSGTVAVFVGYLIVGLIYNNELKSVSFNLFSIIITIVVLIIGVLVLNRYSDLFIGKMVGIDSLGDIANVNTEGGSSYAQYVGNSNNPLNMLIFTLPRIVFFLFSPMPFQWRGISDIIAFFFSSMFYIMALYKTVLYLKNTRDENFTIVQMLFIVALSTMFVFSWGVSNTGTATRHRDKMVILYGVLYALSTAKIVQTQNSSFKHTINKKSKYIK